MTTPSANPRHFKRLRRTLAQTTLWLACALCVLSIPHAWANIRIPPANPDLVESGSPSFVIFGPEALGLQGAPTDLHLLKDGRILAVSQQEISIGDGIRWVGIRRAEDEKDFIPKQVAVDPKGRIFVGVVDGFARLDIADSGRWHLTPVESIQDNKVRRWPRFQSCDFVDGHWYWHSNSGPIIQWDLSGPPRLIGSCNMSDRIFTLDNKLYVSDLATGTLFRSSANGFEPASPNIPADINNNLSCSAPYGERSILVGTNFQGVKIFNGNTLVPLTTKGPLSGGLRINDLCQTNGDFYAAAVDTLGIVFFNREGRIIQILDRKLDHRLNRISRLHYSKDGVLWALLNEGLARIEFPSRISHFETMLDAGLNYIEPLRFHGKLWLQTNGRIMQGVYSDDKRLVGFIENTPSVPFVYTVSCQTGHLLATASEGIFEYTPDMGWSLIFPDIPNARLVSHTPIGKRWLYVAEREVGFIDFNQFPYGIERIPTPQLGSTYGSVQDKEGVIWLELGSGSIARIFTNTPQPRIEILGRANGIPESWAALCVIDGVMRLNCADRIMVFNEKTATFSDDTKLIREYRELNRSSGRPLRDARGRFWISGTDKVSIIDYPADGIPLVEHLPAEFRPFNFYDDTNGVVWMHDNRRFSRYDPDMPQPERRPLNALITHIELPNSNRSIHFLSGKIPDLSYEDNSIVAHFLAPGNPFGQHVSFEIMLEGLDNRWISTGIVGSAIFNRLKEGNYLLRVRPKVGDIPGREASLAFRIHPPWFRSSIAYISYGVGVSLLIALAILIPVYSERRHKAQLEGLVNARTRELNEANGLLARQMKETLRKAAELQTSEERYRKLSLELEHRVDERTAELKSRVAEVEQLNRDLRDSQRETDRAASRLQEVNASLMVANHELESFSYSVSHDLRAPLRNITGFIELLQRKLHARNDRESDRHLEIVVSEARRMGNLIDDLLTFSRIGRADMCLSEVHIESLIDEVREELHQDLVNRNITWKIAPLPPVLGDPTLLRQVIANLIGNAVKFTRKTPEAVIFVDFKPSLENRELITFYIRDNGVGFNPKYMDKLFRVFQRLHTTKDFEGTGIGLANVKRIITRHGGRVWAEGSVNGGATFFFTLKRYTGAPPTPADASTTAPVS